LQVVDADTWQARADEQHEQQSAIPAPRGTIYDRDGVPLAASSEAFRISIAPHDVTDRRGLAKRLQALTKLDQKTIKRSLDTRRKWVQLTGRYDASVRQALDGVAGVHFDRVQMRFYPRGVIAADILGAVNSKGEALSGIELEFDSILAGQPGVALVRRGSRGRAIPGAMVQAQAPRPGRDIYLTIDSDLQEIATEALRAAVDNTKARGGDLLLADPRTGEVLASVSIRSFHADNWRAATEPYEPGSTIKPFTIATLLAEKRARLTDSVFAENGTYTNQGRTLRDVHGMGWMSVAGALQHSSNIALAKLSARLEPQMQYQYLRAFGFGSPTAVTYPSESGGRLQRPFTATWSRFSQASLAIGYEISVTPLQMVLAYGALANGGMLMEPRLVREVRSRDARVTEQFEPRVVRRVIPERVANDIRKVLVDVVETGTGGNAALGPYAVAGKTGTARSFRGGRYESGAYTASFAGFFPAENPQLVFLVKLDSPQGQYYGGVTAAPVTRATLEAALAARSTPLDKRAVAVAAPPPLAEREVAELPVTLSAKRPVTGPFVFALNAGAPKRVSDKASPDRTLPDVRGLSVRDAVRQLHAQGFKVQVQGSGIVRGVSMSRGVAVVFAANGAQ
ncbi:MAG TPA: penicillin-binding transpeptidase domain-containing protein, partial [Longimicrobiales bacterium]